MPATMRAQTVNGRRDRTRTPLTMPAPRSAAAESSADRPKIRGTWQDPGMPPAGSPVGASRQGSVGTGQLRRLTSLRALAALAVFAYHLDLRGVASFWRGAAVLGYTGVGFFFILSGFVLAWASRPGLPAIAFYRRRLARVWPSHAVTWLAALAVPVVLQARDWSAAVPNLLLLQAWWHDVDVAYGMNGVSWSLACEAFFYATFPLAVPVLRRASSRQRWIVCSVALVVQALAGAAIGGYAFHSPVLRYPEFLLGLVAGLSVREGWRPRISGALAGAVLATGLAIGHLVPFPLPGSVLAVPFLVVVLWAATLDLGNRHGLLSRRPLVLAGEASFAFYLVHELVIVNLRGVTGSALGTSFVIFAVACLAAAALHVIVERPLNRLLRGTDAGPTAGLDVGIARR